MAISTLISALKKKSKLSEKEFAALFEISEETLADWESGNSVPDVAQAARLAKHFQISADRLLESGMESDVTPKGNEMLPAYEKLPEWELYSKSLHLEYMQSIEEGLDIAQYKPLFDAIIALPADEYKERMADVLFDVVSHAPTVQGYPHNEPSDLAGIFALCEKYSPKTKTLTEEELKNKIKGAWYGRICGCLLGKPVEGVSCEDILRILQSAGNYPMKGYILKGKLTEELMKECRGFRYDDFCADCVDHAPVDDDTNYVALAQVLISKYGKDFLPAHVAQLWMERQGKNAYCTAERIAYCNFIKGFRPPYSAMHKNSYREWIGAQIRGDYFGCINPGNPEKAAEMAWRDASISHIKNGIYGEMFASAMIACAAVTDDVEDIILGGLSYVPTTSRLYKKIKEVLSDYHSGVGFYEAVEKLKTEYDPANSHGWTHTIPNAAIVVLALLHGKGDFGESICRSVEVGYDTDCNGATVGSIIGIRNGFTAIDKVWTKPVGGKLDTSIFGVGTLDIDKAVEKTMKHIAENSDSEIRG